MIDYLIKTIGRQEFIAIFFFYAMFWSYCLVDSLRSTFKKPKMRWIWIIVIFVTQILGVLTYLIFARFTKHIPTINDFDDD